ncbi:MAG: aldo/keto reductase family oxidoreductase [Janthinobacterium lividum]
MSTDTKLGGTFSFPGTSITVNRMGYGAMQLAGPHVFGPPKDRAAAVAVLREAVETGINHLDTSDFYGPHVTNQIIREALHPYRDGLTLVTKVGARRGDDGSWIMDRTAAWLKQSVEDNLRNLGLDSLPVVNLRIGGVSSPDDTSVEEPLTALAELQQQGLIQHLGLSNVSQKQFEEARSVAKIVCVQNYYNVAHREDDAFLDMLAAEGVAYVPFFPLGGFSPLQSTTLNDAAAALGVTPIVLALAWLLHRSPNVLLIPGTSSVEHLRENISAATLPLPEEVLQTLNGIAARA